MGTLSQGQEQALERGTEAGSNNCLWFALQRRAMICLSEHSSLDKETTESYKPGRGGRRGPVQRSLSRVRISAAPWTAARRIPCPSPPEFTQTHVHRVGDAIQPSHPLSPPSHPASSLPQHQGPSQGATALHSAAQGTEWCVPAAPPALVLPQTPRLTPSVTLSCASPGETAK